jgi:hypothetical protein
VVDAASSVDIFASHKWSVGPFVMDILSPPEEGISAVMFRNDEGAA